MKSHNTSSLRLLPMVLVALLLVFFSGLTPVLAQSGVVTSTATPSTATPALGSTFTVTVNINMSGVNAPDNALGSFDGSLKWNPALITYVSYSWLAGDFTRAVNTGQTGSGTLIFGGVNTDGTTGNIAVMTVTFTAAAAGTSTLDLSYTDMAAANTFTPLTSILNVTDGSVTVQAPVNYTLTAGSSGNGTVTLNPAGGTYASGTTVTLTPVPNSGYTFGSWSGTNAGNIVNTGGIYTIVMNSNKSVTANFTPVVVNYTLTAGNDGHGTVTLNPAGGTYASGTTVTLTPVPSSGYTFGSWSGTNAGNIVNTGGIYTIVMNSNKTVTANFVASGPTGTVQSSAVPSTATPVLGSTFTVTVNINMSGVNAPDNALGSFDGSLKWNPALITYVSYSWLAGDFTRAVNTGQTGSGTLIFGGVNTDGTTGNIAVMTVTFTAAAAGTSTLDLSYTDMAAANTFNSLMSILNVTDGSVTVQTPVNYTLTAGNDGHGTVTLNPAGGSYVSGTTVTLTPVPSTGYTFGSWSGANAGDVVNTGGIYTIVMNGNKSVTANFTANTYTLTAGNDGHGTVTLNPAGGSYTHGTVVTLTPVPSTGYTFGSWSGTNAADVVNAGGIYTIVVNGNKAVTANFTANTYTLTAGNDGNGTVTLNPPGGSYAHGTVVTLTPVPSSGYTFGSWSGANAGDVVNSGGIYTIVMNATKSITANFTPVVVNYTLTAGNDGHGTVTLNPAGGTYAAGTTVTLTPVPSSGYTFGSWSGANAGDVVNTGGIYTIVMNGNKAVTANFTPVVVNYTLTAGNDGHGTVTLNPAGGTYAAGTTVTLTPVPSSGYTFGSWSGANAGDVVNTGGIYTIVMNGNKAVTANFTPVVVNYTLTAGSSGNGTVTLNPAGGTYAAGTTVTLTPVPSSGYTFGSWSGANAGDVVNTGGIYTIVMNGNKAVTANFTPVVVNYTLSVGIIGNGTVTLNPAGGTYAAGTTVTLTPVPSSGYTFGSWSGANAGDVVNTGGRYTIVMNGNKVISANFTPVVVNYTLSVGNDGHGTVTLNPAGGTYAAGTTVTLTPVPSSGYAFSSFSGPNADNVVYSGGVYTIVMNSNKVMTANFSAITYTLTASNDGHGAVNLNPTGGTYSAGLTVTLTPVANTGYTFSTWSGTNAGDIVNSGGVYTIVMNGNKSVTANFRLVNYTLTAGNDGHGTVTLNPAGGTYPSGATVTLTPVPATGYYFSSWSGTNSVDVVNTGGIFTIVMNANKSVIANFAVVTQPPKVQFWATPTKGYPALTVKFNDASEGSPTAWLWEFGDGETSTEENPKHVYWQPGIYWVRLRITTQAGQFTLEKKQFIYVCGFEYSNCAKLDLIDNSLSFPSENWNNAIDHDASGLDGTTTASGNVAYAIFKFHDNTTKVVNSIKMMTNTDVEMEERWTRNFDLYVSTTGLSDADFSLLLRSSKKGGGWEEFECTPTQAKYLKLVLTNPNSGWRQLGEFEVCVARDFPNISKSSVKATSPHIANGIDASTLTITLKKNDGTPLTGLTVDDFYLYSYSGPFTHTDIVETATPGVYTTSITSIEPDVKEVRVLVYCNLIGSVSINFTAPVIQQAALTFVEGSPTFRNEGWDNAIDGDEEGWDGTVTTSGSEPYAIFAFADNSIKAVQEIDLLMDTGLGYEARWIQRFRLQASTTGTASADFVTVYDGVTKGGDWQYFIFPAFNAKYLKLIIDYPKITWRQLGELKVYTTTLALMNQQANGLAQIGEIPQEWSVSNNYPNPFNPETRMQFSLPEASHVTASVFNMLGQKVRTLIKSEVQAGTHQVIWDSRSDAGEPVPSGIYYMRFDLGGRSYTKKLVLTK